MVRLPRADALPLIFWPVTPTAPSPALYAVFVQSTYVSADDLLAQLPIMLRALTQPLVDMNGCELVDAADDSGFMVELRTENVRGPFARSFWCFGSARLLDAIAHADDMSAWIDVADYSHVALYADQSASSPLIYHQHNSALITSAIGHQRSASVVGGSTCAPVSSTP